jgi:hypothetical protein
MAGGMARVRRGAVRPRAVSAVRPTAVGDAPVGKRSGEIACTTRVTEYVFAGTVQHSLFVERTGGWAWFLRSADDEWVGEDGTETWAGAPGASPAALVRAVRNGRLSHRARGTGG